MYRILNFICFSILPFQSLSALEYMANWQKLCYIKCYTYLIKTIKIFIIRLSVNLPRRNGLNYLGTNGAMLVSCPCCSFVFSSFHNQRKISLWRNGFKKIRQMRKYKNSKNIQKCGTQVATKRGSEITPTLSIFINAISYAMSITS